MKQTICRSTGNDNNVKTEHSEYSTTEYFNDPTKMNNHHHSNHQHKIATDNNYKDSKSLKRVFLSNRTITCNDGSQAGFYLRKSITKSKRWVVYLEGGWHCSNASTCKYRWNNFRNLMTSTQWTETRDGNYYIVNVIAINQFKFLFFYFFIIIFNFIFFSGIYYI